MDSLDSINSTPQAEHFTFYLAGVWRNNQNKTLLYHLFNRHSYTSVTIFGMIDRVLQVFLDILHFVKFLNFYGHKGGLKKMFALKDKKQAR